MCERLLAIDELNAGAHYALALCREGDGDRQGAIDHDQVAIYLDGSFAMPRLHLGLVARKRGDLETARRELGQALVLLQREDAARLLLFGGGFGRDALVALCRAELAGCGGSPMTRARDLPGGADELRRAFDRSFAEAPGGAPEADALESLLAIRVGGDPYALRLSEIAGLFADCRRS